MSKHSIRNKTGIFRRQTYVLYKFQTRFALSFVLLSAFDTLMTAFVIYQWMGGRSSPDDPSSTVTSNLTFDSRALFLAAVLLTVLVCSFALLYFITILATHRVAGPIKVMHRYISELERGHFPAMRPLRQHDELKDFFAQLRRLVDGLREKSATETKILKEAIDALAPSVSGLKAQEALGALRALSEQKQSALPDGPMPSEIRAAQPLAEAAPLRAASQ